MRHGATRYVIFVVLWNDLLSTLPTSLLTVLARSAKRALSARHAIPRELACQA